MDLTKIRELLKGLIDDSTSTEKVEAIGKISGELDNLENEEKEFIQKHEELRKKYIDVIKDSSFKGEPQDENTQKPMTLEDCVQAEINKRKEN